MMRKGQRGRLPGLLVILALGIPPCLAAQQADTGNRQPRFEDVTISSGIFFQHERATFDPRLERVMTWVTSIHAGGCAADYDGDGDVDFYLVTAKQGRPNALLANDGSGTFEDVAADAGVADLNDDDSVSMSCFFADLDNDRDQDLFVAAYGRCRLLINDGAGRFTEKGVAAGLKERGNAGTALPFDFDGDGWLDVMVGRYFPHDMRALTTTRIFPTTWVNARNGASNLLYRNNRDGTFTEVAGALKVNDTGWTLAIGAGDLDGDGDLDLYVANDFGPDVVYRNDGNGSFTDVSMLSIGSDGDAGMNAEIADFDNDGRLDVYVTNITNSVFDQGNMLWRNTGNFEFENVSRQQRVRNGGWGWAAKFFDYDHDGVQDLFTVNGFVTDGPDDLFRSAGYVYQGRVDDLSAWPDMRGLSLAGNERDLLFHNDGSGFTEVAEKLGIDSNSDGRGIVLADIEGDGDLDVLVTTVAGGPLLYRNEASRGKWIEADLKGTKGNRDAIGARVTIITGADRRQIREVDPGNGYSGQGTRIIHAGLGTAETVESLEIRWPGGARVRHLGLPAGVRYIIEEGTS
jgi:enediyne biosynthesis protein E4